MTNDRFYQRLSEKLADLPDDPAFDAEGTWARIQLPPRRRAVGAWLWPMGLAASVLLVGGLWLGLWQSSREDAAMPVAVQRVGEKSPAASEVVVVKPAAAQGQPLAKPSAARPNAAWFRTLPKVSTAKSEQVALPDEQPETTSVANPELNVSQPEPPLPALSEPAVAEVAPQPAPAETPSTVVLTIPVPGEDAQPVRKPFVTRLFKQWKRYNRGETVDWEDLGLKSFRLTKARTDSARTPN